MRLNYSYDATNIEPACIDSVNTSEYIYYIAFCNRFDYHWCYYVFGMY